MTRLWRHTSEACNFPLKIDKDCDISTVKIPSHCLIDFEFVTPMHGCLLLQINAYVMNAMNLIELYNLNKFNTGCKKFITPNDIDIIVFCILDTLSFHYLSSYIGQ